ncbi:helix-turn-helix domain-containing protein [Aurantimonas endophytica]|uniref:Excisionase family DNA binding protein n=1 Tax=Aurantimonas endophytica TaxID=1522175 RepID=A0A7W6MN85_9HYPH|nr:helix-turn-helix domain-containing protein [Aurantimonas endophytica]MBB4001625.1 excisionase family DNA binding protein [Aurantimonas endophytica]MCO6402738.1 hypothetical protein [Aurantimonas endophytica]
MGISGADVADQADLPSWPAALTVRLAAAYCGLTESGFRSLCPVPPLSFGQEGHRYLRVHLDRWLVSLPAEVAEATKKPEVSAVMQPNAYTPATLAKRWNCSETLVRNLIRRKELESFKFGGKLIRVSHKSVVAYEAAARVVPKAGT